jgi:hypothetical protein
MVDRHFTPCRVFGQGDHFRSLSGVIIADKISATGMLDFFRRVQALPSDTGSQKAAPIPVCRLEAVREREGQRRQPYRHRQHHGHGSSADDHGGDDQNGKADHHH